MGSCSFEVHYGGKNAKEAFALAVEDAAHQHGHGGYTGTIAEKDSFIHVTVPAGKDPEQYADELIESHSQISSKHGPAGCILLSSRLIETTVEKELPITKTKVQQHIFQGTRKWETYYVVRDISGRELDKNTMKGKALEVAKKLSIKHKTKLIITLEKRLAGSHPLVAEIEPEIKTVPEVVKETWNEYLFFGWASS